MFSPGPAQGYAVPGPAVSATDFSYGAGDYSAGQPESSKSRATSRPPKGKQKVRYRALHHLSDGDSENEDPKRLYRALRADENPLKYGLRPPPGADPTKSAATHIRAGSRAQVPSDHVSLTRSLKTAAAWASTSKDGRVASVRVPSPSVFPKGTYYDTTNPQHFDEVFGPGGGGTAGGFAKGSQEVVVKGGVPKDYVDEVYNVRPLSAKEYDAYKSDPGRDGNYSVVRSRTRTKELPRRVGIFHGERHEDKKNVYRERPREERPRDDRSSVVYMTQEEYDARYGRRRSDSPKESSSRSGRRYY